jgi:diacylglycerol kinase family enzyme
VTTAEATTITRQQGTGRGPVVLIVNPASTRARKGLARDAERVLAPLGLAEVMVTQGHGDAEDLARRAAALGAGVVVTVGGDGTVSQVAAALAGGSVALAPLPAGSTNVFARDLGWPARGDAALRDLAALLARGAEPVEVVLGRLRAGDVDRPFAVNAGAGVDAEAVDIVEAHPWLKRRLRHLGFALAAVAAERRLARGAGLEISVNGRPAVHVGAAVVACGAPYAYLGPRPLDLVPGAAHDGGLAWLGVERVRAVKVAAVVLGAVRGGRHVGRPGVLHGTGAREIVLTAATPFALQADGEPLGRHLRAVLSAGPRLWVLRP